MQIAKPETNLLYRTTSAALAFVIWGGWAYFVNNQSPAPASASPIVSGLIQGSGSCIVTLVMVKSVTHLYHWLAAHPLRLILPAMMTTAATGSCMTVAHILAGTSNLSVTIIPGLIVAFCFNILTTLGLARMERRLKRA